MEDNQYKITIKMDENTIAACKRDGMTLYGFKAAKTNAPKGGKPVVWFAKSDDFTTSDDVTWSESFSAYVSETPISTGAVIQPAWMYRATLGEKIFIDYNYISGMDVKPPVPSDNKDSFSIFNNSEHLVTCGILQHNLLVKEPVPIGAFPIHGNNMTVVAPLPEVVLSFATSSFEVGAVIERQIGNALWIDLTDEKSRTVSYDIDKGWDWEIHYAWARELKPEDNELPEKVIQGGF